MRVVFMGTPDFAVPCLQRLINSDHDIVAVYTAPPKPAHRGKKLAYSAVYHVADEAGLDIYTPSSLKSAENQQQFAHHQADVAIVIAYGLLLPTPILKAPVYGCINVHPSSLPRWRGAAPVQRSIMAGDTQTSLCMMQMDEGLDTGDILMEETYPLTDNMTCGELQFKLATQAAELLLPTLQAIEHHTLLPVPQSEEGITYAQKITKAECMIDFTRPAREVLRHIHGLSPAPGAVCLLAEERIKFLKVEIVEGYADAAPATILDAAFTVQCADDAIRPLIIQRAGKAAMQAADCVRGMTLPVGSTL